MNERNLILRLAEGDKSILKKIYLNNKSSFLKYGYRYKLSDEDLLDIYQDASIALFENAIRGKMNTISCSIKTYLFSIGKNMIYAKMRKNKNTLIVNEDVLKDEYAEEIEIDEETPNSYQIQLQNGLRLLGKQCKKILTLFYYNGYTLEEITVRLNYDKKDVVKSQKSRCLKKLKSIIRNK